MRKIVEKEFACIEGLAQSQSIDVVPRILAIASFLRQMYEHSVDISDLAVPRGALYSLKRAELVTFCGGFPKVTSLSSLSSVVYWVSPFILQWDSIVTYSP